jgi:hypothetical protein
MTDQLRARKEKIRLMGGVGALALSYVVAVLVSFIMISRAV